MTSAKLIFRAHALRRMFQRRIDIEEARQVLATGETIESYPQDVPYSSRLVLGGASTDRCTSSSPTTARPRRASS